MSLVFHMVLPVLLSRGPRFRCIPGCGSDLARFRVVPLATALS